MNTASREDTVNGLRDLLVADGLIPDESAELTPLSGGVSCDVVKVTTPDRIMVVKRALKKLRVQDDWFADPSRNQYEHRYMTVVGEFLPDSVPKVIHTNDESGYFCMQWLGDDWNNWKDLMLAGDADPAIAAKVGTILGRIHRETFANHGLKSAFDNTRNFHDLRLDPYLLTTGRRHPDMEDAFREETNRIRTTRECLVHGDYSPKNILVRDGQAVILDCEVAWFGDPCFDLAFLLNHLHLKSLFHAPGNRGFAALPESAVDAYFRERRLTGAVRDEFDHRTARLLLMLMLARIDGKSPAEYLVGNSEKQNFVRSFVRNRLPSASLTLEDLGRQWIGELLRVSFR